MSGIRRPEVKHLIGAAVAGACVALAMAGGGFEPTAFAAAGLVVWIAIVVGLAIGVVPRSEPPKPAMIAGLALAALAALTALSLAWASDDGHAFEDVVRTLAYLGGFVIVAGTSRRAQARPWLAGLAVGLTVVGAIALLARFEPSLFGDPDADLVATLPAALGRLTYPIGYWNGLAAAMAAAIVLLSWSAATAGSRRVRAAFVGALPPVILALWMTESRGGMIAALLAFGVLVATGPARSRLVANLGVGALAGSILIAIAETHGELLGDPVSPLAAGQGDRMLAITVAFAAAAAAARYALDRWIQPSRFPAAPATSPSPPSRSRPWSRRSPSTRSSSSRSSRHLRAPPSSPTTRSASCGGAVAVVTSSGRPPSTPSGARPLRGWARAATRPTGSSIARSRFPLPGRTRSSSRPWAELGILGFALLATFFACAAVTGVKRARAPDAVAETGPALALLAVGLAAAAVDWTWDLPAVFGLAVVAAALLTGPATLAGPDPGPPSRRYRGQARSRRGFAAGVVLLLVAWGAICGSGLLLLSASSLESSRDAAGRGEIEAAVEAANDAIDLQPWAAEPRTQLALVYEQAGDYERASEQIAEAIDRAPDEYRLRLLATRIEFENGDGDASRAALFEAHRLNPRDPEIQQQVRAAG